MTLPAEPGTYALILEAQQRATVTVGRLGELVLRPGYYVYVGSALGPGGLLARISRHVRREKTCRWHVDYVRRITRLHEVWFTCDAVRRECQWAETLGKLPLSSIATTGFGSSDCRCPAHLYFFEQRPSVAGFRRRLYRHAVTKTLVQRIEMG